MSEVSKEAHLLNEILEPTVGNNLKIPSKTAEQVIKDSCHQRSKGMLANYANELSGN